MRLQHDRERNALRLTLDDNHAQVVSRRIIPGLVDVAANGRLVGIELRTSERERQLAGTFHRWTTDPVASNFVELDADGTVYMALTAGDAAEESRSSTVELEMELDASEALVAVSIPRRGAGYEISYPSGNR